jgi:hypothetical protein
LTVRDRGIAAALFCLLLGAYLLVYVPRVDSIDGQAILAVSASVARTGTFQIGQIGAQDSLLPQQMARMGAFGLDGNYYSKKGVAPSLLFVPVVWIADALRLDLRVLAMLFNPVVTALTGVMLYALVRTFGYAARVAFLTALLYGIATFALVYTKTLYAEPLAALLLTIAVWALIKINYRDTEASPPTPLSVRDASALGKSRVDLVRVTGEGESERDGAYFKRERGPSYFAFIPGLCLGLLMGINLVYALLVPVVVGWLAVTQWQVGRGPTGTSFGRTPRPYTDLIRSGGYLLIPVFICAALIALYNMLRFGSLTSTGYHFAAGEGFTRPFLEGFLGQLISPYRGLLWYNPVLLLAIPGWLMLRRARPAAAWLVFALVLASVGAFSTWWSWEGGIAWGARFTLTITPLVAVCLAPLVALVSGSKQATGSKLQGLGPMLVAGGWWLVAISLIAFSLLSVGIQLLGAGYSLYPFVEYLYRFGDRQSLYDPLQSAVIGHLALANAGWPLEPAWMASGLNLPHLLIALVLISFAVGQRFLLKLEDQTGGSRLLPFRSVALPLCLSAVSLFLLARLYTPSASPIHDLTAVLNPPGRVLIASTHFDESVLDLPLREAVVSTNAPTTPDDTLAASLTASALQGGGNLWLVTWFPSATQENWQEQALWECCAFGIQRSVAGHRALLFSLETPPAADQSADYIFGEQVRLLGYGFTQTDDGLLVTLEWAAGTAPSDGINWFAHLLDAEGNILAQQDRVPAGGFSRLADVAENDRLLDRLYFPGVVDGANLRLGWVNSATAERLPVRDGVGQLVEEGFVLLSLR